MIPETVFTMLACARLGAPTRSIFGGFSAEALHTRIDDAQCKVVVTTDGQFRRGKPSPLKPAVDEALPQDNPVEKVLVVRRTDTDVDLDRGPRRLVARPRRPPARHPRGAAPRQRAPAVHPLHERHDREAQGHLPHERRLPHPGGLHQRRRPRRAPRDRRLLVHRRRRLGDRPLLHRLRAARERRHPGDVRGHPRHPAPGPLVGAHREVRRDDPLHRAHGHPHVHEVGRRHPGEVRPVVACASSAASASRSTPRRGSGTARTSAADRAPIVDTWWQTETGAIMISPLPGVTTLEPGSAQRPIPGHLRRDPRRRRPAVHRGREGRLPRAHQAVAGDAPRHLGRPRALQGDLLEPVRAEVLLRRRRREVRRRRATSGCSAGSTTS